MRFHSLLSIALVLAASTLVAQADTVTTFNLVDGTFANGATITGTVSIDTTSGVFTTEDFTVDYGHSSYVFDGPITTQGSVYHGDGYFGTMTNSQGAFLNLTVLGSYFDSQTGNNTLIGYAGGPVCSLSTFCDSSYSQYTPAYNGGGLLQSGDLIAQTSPVPEPSTLALLGTGILGLAGMARRKFLA